uniref:helix-turn-helix domain-containing protein n=1 Tax=Faecalicoccus pleomorphus TaxID=1323 RepID=UPI00242A74E0
RMYTRDEVAEMIGCHKDHVVMLSEVGCLKSIRIGKRYMYSYEAIKQFQKDYEGLDLSNKVKALQAYSLVNKSK